MKIERFFEMPNIHTFEMKKLRDWFIQYVEGDVLNIFGGYTKLDYGKGKIVYNDINENIPSDYHYDAMNISQHFSPESFDTILFDPPYTDFQATHYYDGKLCRDLDRAKSEADKLLKPGGVAISFGYNSTGFGKKRGYKKLAILLVNCGFGHNDIIVTVERKTQTKLFAFGDEEDNSCA